MELGRAQQTIYQLQSNLNSIQKIRKDIRDQDVLKFDAKMTTIRMEIMEEINKFAQLDSAHIEYLGEEFSDLLKEGKWTMMRQEQYFLPIPRVFTILAKWITYAVVCICQY